MIPRSQIIGRLREENYTHSKQGKRVDILRQHGTGQHISVPRRDLFTPQEAGIILRLAGIPSDRVEQFLKDCLKD